MTPHLPDWLLWIGSSGIGAIALYASQNALAWRKQRHDEDTTAESTGLEIKKHRDRLTVEMLEMARAELKSARTEIEELRAEIRARDDELARLTRIEWRLTAYEEAIEHIEALILADQGGREAAEHGAQLFLARMEAMKLKVGAEANAEQVKRAARKLAPPGN